MASSSPWKKPDCNFRLVKDILAKKGSFGQVYKAVSTIDPGHEYAIKEIKIAAFARKIQSLLLTSTNLTEKKSWREILQVLLNEINNQSLNTCEFIVRSEMCWFEGRNAATFNNLDKCSHNNECLIEITIDGDSSAGSVDLDRLYIPMEWCESDLAKWIITNGKNINLKYLYSIWKNILEGLKELHRNNIIHRDIKPANILLQCESGTIGIPYKAKIGDFGLSTIIKDPNNKNPWQKCTVGTEKYRSPEMSEGKGNYSEKTDVFSAGLTFMECLWVAKTGCKIDPLLFDELRNGKSIQFLEDLNKQNLISSMCQVDFETRGSASSFLPLVEDLEKLENSSFVIEQEDACTFGTFAENVSLVNDVDNYSPTQLRDTRSEEYNFVTYSNRRYYF